MFTGLDPDLPAISKTMEMEEKCSYQRLRNLIRGSKTGCNHPSVRRILLRHQEPEQEILIPQKGI